MMSIKCNLQDTLDISDYQRQWNSCYRSAYNRKVEGLTDTQIDNYLDNLNHVEFIDKTMRVSARLRAVQNFNTTKNESPIFGGKKNFWDRKFNKITQEEYRQNRLSPLFQTGDKLQDGNRKFKLDVIENNRLIFKPNRKTNFYISLTNISRKYRDQLCQLQLLCEQKLTSFSAELTPDWVSVSFDEKVFAQPRKNIVKNRVLSFDMNPNYIGMAIVDVLNDGKDQKIVHREVISLERLNKFKRGKSSTERTPDNDKRKHETCEVGKYIVGLAEHYGVELVTFEKLDMKSSDRGKGKQYNRQTNNNWLRNKLTQVVKRRCNIGSIAFVESLPQYSSFVGCLEHPTETDSIGAALELGRRGYLFYRMYILKDLQKGDVVFPSYDRAHLTTLWTQEMSSKVHSVRTWKGLYSLVKDSGLSYRVLWKDWKKKHSNSYQSLSLMSRKSGVERFVLQ